MTQSVRRRLDGARGILAGVDRLQTSLHLSLVLLTVASAIRYLQNHPFHGRSGWVLVGAVATLLWYAAYQVAPWRDRRAWPALWCVGLLLTWFALVVAAPSFAWCAVPLAFVALRVLPFPVAVGLIAAMVATVSVAWTQMRGTLDLTVVMGPACVALLAVTAYRALAQEALDRQRLLEDLQEAQGDLAQAQRRVGAAAERARLSRDIHDSVAQHLSSINLLLQAAEQDWEAKPGMARQRTRQAASTARDGLTEVRRVVSALAPAQPLDPMAFAAELRAACEQAVEHSDIRLGVAVHGDAIPLPEDVASALLRTARGALANVVEHARADRAAVTLTYQGDSVSLDVRDDGRGLPPRGGAAAGGNRGYGLSGLRSRAAALGGEMAVESAPGEGTAVAVSLPVPRALVAP